MFRKSRVAPQAAFDPDPGSVHQMPHRPYRVLHAGLVFYSDPECRNAVAGAGLLVLQCEDPKQDHRPIECMPTRKNYGRDDLVRWDVDKDKLYAAAWYRDPETGGPRKAWAQSVEFTGPIVRLVGD